jgi:K+ transporter
MRADNEGEGGTLALVAVLRKRLHGPRRVAVAAVTLGHRRCGTPLWGYGHHPTISVMSAIEGVVVENPSLDGLVLPVSVAILSVRFGIQRWGKDVLHSRQRCPLRPITSRFGEEGMASVDQNRQRLAIGMDPRKRPSRSR